MFLGNLTETIAFGENFARQISPKSIILLKGPIGAGKTSFVQGIGKGLSITETISSPTFALSHHYLTGLIPLIHMDLYRIENSISARELFLEEEEDLEVTKGILIVEWPELILPILEEYWLVEIKYGEKNGRNFQISEPNLSKNS